MFLFLSPLTFFGLPLFCFSFSVSLFFLSFFLPSCLSFCFLLIPFFFVFSVFFAFVSWKEQHETFQLQFIFSWNIFSFFWFLVLLFLSNPFLLSLLFLILSYVFSNINVFGFKKEQSWKTPFNGQKGSCNKTGFLWTCVLENVKSYRFFLPIFCQILVDVPKTL